MKIAIMQPTYLPWIGYFDLMDQVDVYVFLDNVQFVRGSWQQRNRIKTPRGLEWLTVPVYARGLRSQLIMGTQICEPGFWKKHARAIEHNYRKAPWFQTYWGLIVKALEEYWQTGLLAELNIGFISMIGDILGVRTRVIRASTIGVTGKRSNSLASICQELGAKEYLAALGSVAYLKDELHEFTSRAIAVAFHNYEHPIYFQQFPPFLEFASCIDLLMNEGPKSLEIIRSGRREAFGEVPTQTVSKI